MKALLKRLGSAATRQSQVLFLFCKGDSETVKQFVLLLSILAIVSSMSAQQGGTSTSAGSVKLPVERSNQLKQIQQRQDELAREYQALDQQKLIVAQRAAMELKLSVEQFDQMDLKVSSEGYVFQPKPKATPISPQK